jgi:hypothetical protein
MPSNNLRKQYYDMLEKQLQPKQEPQPKAKNPVTTLKSLAMKRMK